MRFVSLMLAMCVCVIDAQAQSPPADVPEIAQAEIARRGSHVEQTGTIRSGLMAAALAPPADDSAKWFLTIVVKDKDDASQRLQTLFATDPGLRAWVDVRDPLKSTMHFHVRSIDDATQADWLKGLQPAIQRFGLPMVVLQPPRNQQFGPTSTIVKIIAGNVATGSDMAKRLKEGIVEYVRTIEQSPGISQPSVSAPPPFQVPPKEPPAVAPAVPFDWPPAPTPNPQTPAPDAPTSWLAMIVSGLGIYVAGWVSARIKTLAGAKFAQLTRLLDGLNVPK